MNVLTIDRVISLLLIATLVALAARRLRLPYTVGLVIAGIALAIVQHGTGAALTHDLIFKALLPPLLFEAALNIHWLQLRREVLLTLLLATLGVVISASVVAVGMHAFVHWPWSAALIFGVLIAATDPVAVIAMLKDAGLTGRLRTLIEAESLLNDGTSATLFTLMLAFLPGTAPHAHTLGSPLAALLTNVIGGIVIGAACGAMAIVLAGRTTDHLVETMLTTVAAYGSFLLAEHFGISGILATVTAGAVLGSFGVLCGDAQDAISLRGREVVLAFWDFAAFVANSLVFLLIGLRVAHIPFGNLGLSALLIAILLVLASRALSVYPICAAVSRTAGRVRLQEQHLLFWGGLRGALALALALSLPQSIIYRDEIVIAAFGVVAFSIIVQGITMPMLLQKLSLVSVKGS